MDDIKQLDTWIKQTLNKVQGIQAVCSILPEDQLRILALEEEAEKRSLMGLGKVINTGVREVLQFDSIYVALTNLQFSWGHCATLILKKGDRIVGEEIYAETAIAELRKNKNVWFMHKNFVIYKDLVSFPKDIMQKICHFEIPGLTADWLTSDKKNGVRFNVRYGNPSTFCDVHLKKVYFDGAAEKGLGTILIGIKQIFTTGEEDNQ
jgi:hypothetical protein